MDVKGDALKHAPSVGSLPAKTFAHHASARVELPNLIEPQLDSFKWFVENALKEVFAFVEFAGDLSDIRRRLEHDPKDSIALYQLGATSAINGNFANALDAFLKVVLYDRNYQDDGGRRAILKIFNALGGQGELVTQYRRRLGALLF